MAITRRTALGAMGIGSVCASTGTTFMEPASETGHGGLSATTVQEETDEVKQKDKQNIMKAGLNEPEAECWRKVVEATAAFFALPELHPLDKAEVATAVHVIQNKLLARPTYRKYLEISKAAFGDLKKNEK